jgi:hypothetical protein
MREAVSARPLDCPAILRAEGNHGVEFLIGECNTKQVLQYTGSYSYLSTSSLVDETK